MSLFEELILKKIRELEELEKNLVVEVETKIRKEADVVLNKYSEQITKVESDVVLEREKMLYDAVVESRRALAETYENLLKDLIEAVFEEVDRLRGQERYIKFLRSLIENAVNYIQSKEMVIYASPKDRGVVESIARTLGLMGIVSERDIRGGVVVSTKDGSVVVDYSLESIIANKIEELKHLLYRETV
ncbi:MAG: V-type ATP synthase subunit E [Pyrobaculum sp.]